MPCPHGWAASRRLAPWGSDAYLLCAAQEDTFMSAANRLSGFLEALRSAVAASAAVERGARPHSRDLRSLGIDPEQFGRIGR
jgi:hypothetical protein